MGAPDHRLGMEPLLDISEARLLYRSSLARQAGCVNRRRRRKFRAMERAVDEHDGMTLDAADEEVWVWSDLHLGHANIIEYAARPFAGVDEMNASLWRQWERIGGRASTMVVVGDLAMGSAVSDNTWARVQGTGPGKKILVLGNHDLTGSGKVRVEGFDEMGSLMLCAGDPPLVWTHFPLDDVPEGWVNVHGHEHDAPPRDSRHINVCVEHLDFAPVSLGRIRALARALVRGSAPTCGRTIERIETIEARSAAGGN